jgi:hypothetical protein
MDPHAVMAAMRHGAPLTCATCRHFHDNRGWCGKQETCGGPPSGRDFPDYDGPVTRSNFATRCLICGHGEITTHALVGKTKFGLCTVHRRVFVHVGRDPGQLVHPVVTVAAE